MIWRVSEGDARRATAYVDVLPALDNEATDAYGGGDLWALAWHAGELGENGGTIDECQEGLDAYVNREGIGGGDLVLWMGVHSRHEQACCASVDHCEEESFTMQFSW